MADVVQNSYQFSSIPVAALHDTGQIATVYILRIDDYQTYFVGSPT